MRTAKTSLCEILDFSLLGLDLSGKPSLVFGQSKSGPTSLWKAGLVPFEPGSLVCFLWLFFGPGF